jgi:hypothetical protein
MPRRKDPNPKPAHRPLIPIDWQFVDKMIKAQCSGVEIAGALNVCIDTFYDRFKVEKGVCFSEARPPIQEGGKGMLRLRQYTSAMQGNTSMLKTLGEEYLGQGRKSSDLPPNESDLKEIHTALKKDLPESGDALKELHDTSTEKLNGSESEANPIIPASDQTI